MGVYIMNVLILSASTGGGHMRASSALKSYILERSPDSIVEIVDTFAAISPLLNKTVSDGYQYLATKTPKMYGSLYKSTNKDTGLGSLLVGFNHLFSKMLLPLLEKYHPDIIVCTHAFPTEMVSNLKEMGLVTVPLMCIMTDYAPHQTWINKRVDSYIVANDAMIDVMVDMGAPRELIHPFGIPIDHAFFTQKDRVAILREMKLNPDIPTILIMAGSFGVTNILKIYNKIITIDEDFQIIVITGRNQRLYEAFNRILYKNLQPKRKVNLHLSTKSKKFLMHHSLSDSRRRAKVKKPVQKPTKLLFFTSEVDKYMQVSDLIITKPGGLTVSEALACNLPMAIFNAIPGQEEENADFLIDNNMAVRIEKSSTCAQTIQDLLRNRDRLAQMKQYCETFDKSNSGKNIYEEILSLIG